ncbi:MAG: C25 family cysteine peptidase [Bacteroidota bacterium]
MRPFILASIATILSICALPAQMYDNQFGNEWIDKSQVYHKIDIGQDGIYRLNQQTLSNVGIPVSAINGSQYRLYRMGEEVPMFVSSNGIFGSSDYIEFFGQQNRTELDRYLFEDPEDMLNPEYSLYTDTAAYYLTWSTTSTSLRYTNQANELNSLPAKEDYFMYDQVDVKVRTTYNDRDFVKTRLNNEQAAYSDYTRAEGFSLGFPSSNAQTISLEPKGVYTSGPVSSELTMRYATGLGEHRTIISINNEEVDDETVFGYTLHNKSFPLNTNSIGEKIDIMLAGQVGVNDKQAVSVITLNYPRSYDFSDLDFFIFELDPSSSKKYLEISDFQANGQNPILYDLTNRQRMIASLENGLVRIALPPSSQKRRLVLCSATAVQNMVPSQAVNFVDFTQEDPEYVILTSTRLYSNGNPVQEYADYRASQQGGGYRTLIVEIEQLYEQFSYGVQRHPLSVRNFAQYVSTRWPNLRYFFIIGKGREYHRVRTVEDFNKVENDSYYVPSYGIPASDNLLIGKKNSDLALFSVGRLAATNTNEVRSYLDKVRDLENSQRSPQTIDGREWMKHVLHLGGGTTAGEQGAIKTTLTTMELSLENNTFGGEVSSFYKNSVDPIQISRSEQIFNRINEGLSIITFFGHSGVGTFDFNIDNPLNYENFGKYPLMISLGCYSGNIHTPAKGLSERFVFLQNKGAIAFMASTGLGYISALSQMGKDIYALAGGELYGAGIGDILKQAVTPYDGNSDFSIRGLVQQFTLQGDPAIKLNPHPGPDYLVDAEKVSFNPAILDSRLDSFDLQFTITNIGSTVDDSIMVILRQELPNGQERDLRKEKILAPKFSDDYVYTIPNFGIEAVGLNKFFIEIDTENEIEELPNPDAELNNELIRSSGEKGITKFIIDNTARPVYPHEFAIVNQNDIVLKASTVNALTGEQTYAIEIDTTALFDSPSKRQTRITQRGGVIEWQPDLNYEAETVYYWRVSPDSLSTGASYTWSQSSFIYLPNGTPGWNQSHYFQHVDNESEGILLNEEDKRGFSFSNEFREFKIRNKLFDPIDPPGFFFNGGVTESVLQWQITEGVFVAIVDSASGRLVPNPPPGNYGSVNLSVPNLRSFPFKTDDVQSRSDLINFLRDTISPGNYVFFWTAHRFPESELYADQWAADSVSLGTNIFTVLEDQGAFNVRRLETIGTVPYAFVYQKDRGAITEDLSSTLEGEAFGEVVVPRQRTEGAFKSVVIGPAEEWESLSWSVSQVDNLVQDSFYLEIIGINRDNVESVLLRDIKDFEYDLREVKTKEYPYIQLNWYSKDDVNRSTVQLDHWRVQYRGVPEAAVVPNLRYSLYSDTLQQGDQMSMEVAIQNIGQYAMDSLLISYRLGDSRNNEQIFTKRLASTAIGDTLNTSFSIDTRQLSGANTLLLEINPDQDQPEQYQFNNFVLSEFFVEQDIRNPLLDVTFDGLHIMDGDIVSSKPFITIGLTDENRFLELSDTALFKLFITYPDGTLRNIPMHDEIVQFYPADANNLDRKNVATIELTPAFAENGTYSLIVQAEDATGNQSGDIDYKIAFKVITEQTISNVMNYPNPFSTATRFLYTLTGEEAPAQFKIQILTVSGRIVREITQDELGPLRVGTHLTDFVWDGTDEFGNRLANGVYLYRVSAKKSNGEDYELFQSGADKFFKNGFGKLVILR